MAGVNRIQIMGSSLLMPSGLVHNVRGTCPPGVLACRCLNGPKATRKERISSYPWSCHVLLYLGNREGGAFFISDLSRPGNHYGTWRKPTHPLTSLDCCGGPSVAQRLQLASWKKGGKVLGKKHCHWWPPCPSSVHYSHMQRIKSPSLQIPHRSGE